MLSIIAQLLSIWLVLAAALAIGVSAILHAMSSLPIPLPAPVAEQAMFHEIASPRCEVLVSRESGL